MDSKQAQQTIKDVLEHAFNRETFIHLIRNLLNHIEPRDKHYSNQYVPEAYREHINQYWRVGKYSTPDNEEIDILIVEVKNQSKLDRARTTLRNFAINRLKQFEKEYSLIAFYSKEDQGADWRFSFIKMEHEAYFDDKGKVKTKTDLTPAKRYSFLVGEHESAYTACKQLLPLLKEDVADPSLQDIENAFSIEKVTDEFFQQYKELYIKLSEHLKTQSLFQSGSEEEQKQKVTRFAKKLLGQIVFLYFLQKKGWLGVAKDEPWGKGDKKFLSNRYQQTTNNYYADFLQYLFYEALAQEREKDGYYPHFECKIPFLNGGLFEADYDWKHKPVEIPNELFRNTEKNKAGDTGTGILDVFDRYNFTIKEDEPLEKEVAVDPEMLGKVFENMLEVTERKSKGAFYTPREIVHYMCQESLIQYLYQAVQFIPKTDLETFVRNGHLFLENDALARQAEQKVASGELKSTTHHSGLSGSIYEHAKLLDEKLTSIKICDPAIGSGAFPVGLLHEIVTARLTLQSITGSDVNAYELKRHCIQESIYGVDIDASAIDISRLRLWLSLIVDESDYDTITALPNLDYKIMQGNSLVEDFDGVQLFNDDFINLHDETEIEITRLKEQQTILQKQFITLHKDNLLTSEKKHELEKQNKALIQKIKKLQTSLINQDTQLDMNDLDIISVAKIKAEKLEKLHKVFFSACTPVKKAEIRKQISTLEWELIEATLKERKQTDTLEKIQVLKQSNEKPFFLWKLNFPEVFKQHGGFDVVIGNPPYGVSIKGDYRKAILSSLGKVPDYEIYYYFIELSKKVLSKNGIQAYIIPNTYLFNTFAAQYRKEITKEWGIIEILDCTKFNIFKSATVRNTINIWSKTKLNTIGYRNTKNINSFSEILKRPREFIDIDELLAINQNWGLAFYLEKKVVTTLLKLKNNKTQLSVYFPKISQGLIAYDKYKGQSEEIIKSRAFHYDSEEKEGLKKWIKGADVSRYEVKWNGQKYIDYCDGIANPRKPFYFKGDRILIREITNPTVYAGLTNEELYNDPSIIIIVNSKDYSLKVLLSILNSEIASFFHFNNSPKATKGAFPKILVKDVKEFPLPVIKGINTPFEILIDYLIFLKGLNRTLVIGFFDALVNGMVYELYFYNEINTANKPLLKHLGDLKPITEEMRTEEKLAIIQAEFDRLYDPSHLVRNHLETLDSIEEIRIIKEALQ